MSDARLDSAYNIEAFTPNMEQTQARFAALSAKVSGRANARLDVAYGPDPRHKLDIFPTDRQGQPALLFFHGGFWKAGSKETRRFPAPAWNERGAAWISIEYRLAPAASLDDIADDARRALAWIHGNLAGHGCDPDALHLVGNSAGAQMVAMLAAAGWAKEYGLPEDVVRSATVLSGLFDLVPLVDSFANEWLSLDPEAARRNSPIHTPPRKGLQMVVSVGGQEPDAFRYQSRAYADACKRSGAAVDYFERPAADHLSIIGELADPESPLFLSMNRIVTGRA